MHRRRWGLTCSCALGALLAISPSALCAQSGALRAAPATSHPRAAQADSAYVSLLGRGDRELRAATAPAIAFLVPRDAGLRPPRAPRWGELVASLATHDAATLARTLRGSPTSTARDEPLDFELTWRAARIAYGIAMIAPDWSEQSVWLRWGIVWSLEAVAAEATARGDHRGLEGMAWLMANVGQFALLSPSAPDRAQAAEIAYQLAARILAVDPEHPTAHNVMGRVHAEVMRLSRTSRLLARAYMGSEFVTRSSWATAEQHLRRAVVLDPGMMQFRLDLLQLYQDRGDRARAEQEWTALLRLPDRHPTDGWLRRRGAEARASSPRTSLNPSPSRPIH